MQSTIQYSQGQFLQTKTSKRCHMINDLITLGCRFKSRIMVEKSHLPQENRFSMKASENGDQEMPSDNEDSDELDEDISSEGRVMFHQ